MQAHTQRELGPPGDAGAPLHRDAARVAALYPVRPSPERPARGPRTRGNAPWAVIIPDSARARLTPMADYGT